MRVHKLDRGWIEVQADLYIPIRTGTVLGNPLGLELRTIFKRVQGAALPRWFYIGGTFTNPFKGGPTNPYHVRVVSQIIYWVI